MSGCMPEDKPLISIVLAVYHPKMDWLVEQLDSLNAQTYPNLELIICDDGPDKPVNERVYQEHITAFPWRCLCNRENLGSNKTFERLTMEAQGEYIAYCDQDDIWMPHKLEHLETQMVKDGADLICSDVIPMDARGSDLAGSITGIRPRHKFRQGTGLAPYLVYRNFVIGCTMLIRREMAQASLPFAKHMVHDHYLAFYTALEGNIAVSRECLVRYRIHENNQTGILAHIADRRDYCKKHLAPFCARVDELRKRFSLPELEQAAQWAAARRNNAARQAGGMRTLWSLRRISRTTTLFELVALRLPSPFFQMALRLIQIGKL